MKKYTLLISVVLISFHSSTQCDTLRYNKPIFNSFNEHLNVKYGEATVWNIPYNKTDLKMNIYTPSNDTLTKRPLMIWVHPGGFLLGNKELDDMVALCDSFVRRGFVTATIDYRKGMNPASESSMERAVYRGVQDLRAAIRFLKEKHVDYGIDTNYTFIGGSSAGAFSVLHTVYLNQEEAPSSIESGLGYPALGCLDCDGNDYQHAMNITGYVSLWGALGDSTWINEVETVPGLLVHGTADMIVPFKIGHPFSSPTTPKTHGSMCISNQLEALNIPHTTYFVEGEGHEFHGTTNGNWVLPPTPYYDTIFHLIETHYADLVKSPLLEIEGTSTICFQDTAIYSIDCPEGYKFCWQVENGEIIEEGWNFIKVAFNEEGNAEINVKQFNTIGAYNGSASYSIEVMPPVEVDFSYETNGLEVSFSPEITGFTNYVWNFGDGIIDGSMNPTHTYNAPGDYIVTLTVTDIQNCKGSAEKEVELLPLSLLTFDDVFFQFYPNPAQNKITIQTNSNYKGTIDLLDISGKIVKTFSIQQQKEEINIEEINSGVYFISIPKLGIKEKVYIVN